MALFLEFLLTILLSLLFSFLLAKLFSLSSSSTSSDEDHVSVLSPSKLMIKKLVSCERLFVAESTKNDSGGEARIGFIAEVVEVDDFGESRQEKIGSQETLNECCGSRSGFKIDESEGLGELSQFGGVSEFEDKLVVESTESEKGAKSEEIEVAESECDNEIPEASKSEEDGGVCDCEEILVDESGESGRINIIERELCKNETLFDEDDDWEGIERTELERLFGSAVAFVGSKSNADRIGSLVKMQLYGLHKIATQGPCHDPQPMALKVSARANWYCIFSFDF